MAKNTVLSHLDLGLPKTRIMATIGKANYEAKQLQQMLENGASIFRFNAARIKKNSDPDLKKNRDFDFEPNPKVSSVLENIELLSEARRQPITTSLDLAGPKVRVKKLISIHKREKETREGKPLKHPEVEDIVYLYSNDVTWDDENIEETLGSIEPSAIHSTSPDSHKDNEEDEQPACIDNIWRIHTTIHSFKTVEEYISVKDGKCNLQIESRSPQNDFVKTKVVEVANDFFFSPTQGVNPKGYMFPNILQVKDLEDFKWALDNNFDLICVSFVCSPLEYFRLKKEMIKLNKNRERGDWSPPLIFAKIETIFAVDPDKAKIYFQTKYLKNEDVYEACVPKEDHERYLRLIELYKKNPIEAICETFDGVMVARGDLAVEADKYHVPFYQKVIIKACHLFNKPVIVATEVLQSMGSGNPSTRAEIGDIATAVLDGADVIMLAGEVASAKSDPAKVVEELKVAIQTAEEAEEKEKWLQKAGDVQYFYEKFSRCLNDAESHLKKMEDLELLPSENVESVRWKIGMGSRVCLAARAKDASAIFVSVTTGTTAKYISYFRPVQHIISIGSSLEVARRLLLWKGIYPTVMRYSPKHDLNDFILIARELHSEINIKPAAEWKKKKEFVIPGLLRIESKLQDEDDKKLLPNTVHEIPLPVPQEDKSPEGIPEREIKYILTESYYKTLKKHLTEKYMQKVRLIDQENYYFYDKSGVIAAKKAMIRIRIRKVDQKPKRAILTIKKKGKKEEGGTEERWEKEFNVTPYFFPNGSYNRIDVSFDSLHEFFREFIWNEFKDDFNQKGIKSPLDIKFEKIATMTNTRLTIETHNELTLELDAFSTRKDCNYYELEIETIAPGDDSRRDEYIELLFERLEIPIACNKDYPSKFVRTLIDFGLLEMPDECREAIADVEKKLGVSIGCHEF